MILLHSLIFVIIFVIIFVLIFVLINCKNIYNYFNSNNSPKCYICLTTIPERIINPWFYENLKYLINLVKDTNMIMILYVPYISSKNEKYIIPPNVQNLISNSFKIERVKEDLGPITKYSAVLQNNSISDDSVITVIDDDIKYKDIFKLLYNTVLESPNKVSVMCYKGIEGYKGLAFKKILFKNFKFLKRAPICFTVDDDVIQYFVNKTNIEINVVPFDINPFQHWACSMYQKQTDTHPKWTELNKINQNKPNLKKLCIEKLNELNK